MEHYKQSPYYFLPIVHPTVGFKQSVICSLARSILYLHITLSPLCSCVHSNSRHHVHNGQAMTSYTTTRNSTPYPIVVNENRITFSIASVKDWWYDKIRWFVWLDNNTNKSCVYYFYYMAGHSNGYLQLWSRDCLFSSYSRGKVKVS